MTVLTAEARRPDARGISRPAGFCVEFFRDWKQAAARWTDVRASTLFQDPHWLDAWYRAFAGVDHVEPLIAIISDAATSVQVALLPLVRRMQNGIRIVEFADLDLTDYNAPMLGAGGAARCECGSRAVARSAGGVAADARRRRSRSPAQDAVRSRRQAQSAGAARWRQRQVLSTATSSRPAMISTPTAIRWSEPSARSWNEAGACLPAIPPRRSRSSPTATMRCACSSTMEIQQEARMRHLGLNFILNGETCAAFYRNLVERKSRAAAMPCCRR